MNNIIKKFKLFEDSYNDVSEPSEMDFTHDEVDDLNKSSNSISNTDSNDDSYEELLNSVKELLEDAKEKQSENLEDIKEKIEKDGIDSATIPSFTNENDIYDFYLENKFNIDNKLVDIEFFNDAPVKYNCKSLYEYVITGTKVAVESIILDM